MIRLLASLVLAMVVAVPVRASAAEIPPPSGQVILTVTGKIAHTNNEGRAEFDRDALLSLDLHEVRTTTSWTDGVSVFEGPLLCDLLDLVGASGSVVSARALNDYTADIPVEDCRRYPVVLALRQDGRDLSVRDKGPIWIVYPRDQYAQLRNGVINSRWVWQLVRLEVR